MSVEATTRRDSAVGRGVSTLDNIGYRLQRLPLHLIIIIFCAIWIVPTVGMVINSFRSLQDMGDAGWWTTLFPPHGFTLASYQQVLAIDGVPALSALKSSSLVRCTAKRAGCPATRGGYSI